MNQDKYNDFSRLEGDITKVEGCFEEVKLRNKVRILYVHYKHEMMMMIRNIGDFQITAKDTGEFLVESNYFYLEVLGCKDGWVFVESEQEDINYCLDLGIISEAEIIKTNLPEGFKRSEDTIHKVKFTDKVRLDFNDCPEFITRYFKLPLIVSDIHKPLFVEVEMEVV